MGTLTIGDPQGEFVKIGDLDGEKCSSCGQIIEGAAYWSVETGYRCFFCLAKNYKSLQKGADSIQGGK